MTQINKVQQSPPAILRMQNLSDRIREYTNLNK